MSNDKSMIAENNGAAVKKKMTANDCIICIVDAINKDKRDLAYKAAEEYLSGLAVGGDTGYRIKQLLSQKSMKILSLSELPYDIRNLVSNRPMKTENVFLNETTREFLDTLLKEWENKEVYNYHNLGIRSKVLLHGPTGNGKTTIARYLAVRSNLPFIEVNADMMIDSHVGSSGQNIHKVLSKINEPCVLFWDEVDTIGRRRGGGKESAAGMENERMVNSMLTNIEKMGSDVIFIGATNRREVLDSAFLRRFDVQFEIGTPSNEEKERYAKQLLEFYKLPESYAPVSFNKFDNYSEIKLHFTAKAREFVQSKIKS